MTRTPPASEHERRIAALERVLGIGSVPVGLPVSARWSLPRRWMEAGALLLLPWALLMAAHFLLIIRFSHLSPLYLLAATVLLPLPFGFLVAARALPRLRLWVGSGFVMALLATLGMSAVTALVDDSPWLPQSRRDGLELVQFTCSIGLSFATGMILGWMLWRRITVHDETRHRGGLPYRLVRRLLGPRYSPEQAHRASVLVLSALRLLTACATITGSLLTGWHRIVAV